MATKTLSVKLSLNDKQFQTNLRKATRSISKFGKQMKKTGATLSRNLTLPIVAFGAASVKAFDDQVKAETKLRTSLKGNEEAFKSLATQARELQKITLFGDEATLEAQAFLAQLGLNEEAILKLTPLIQDFATAQGIGLGDAAKLVAKSVGSSTNALSRYGITIEGTVGEQDRLTSAVNALSVAFGGQSEAIAKEGLGPLQQLKNELGDVSEKFGELILDNIEPLKTALNSLANFLGNLSKEQKETILKVAGLVAVLGPLLVIIGSIAGAISTLIPIVVGLVSAFNPLVAVGLGVAAGLTFLGKKLGLFGDEAEEVSEDIEEVVGQFDKLEKAIPTKTISTPKRQTLAPIESIKAEAIDIDFDKMASGFKMVKVEAQGLVETISPMQEMVNTIQGAFTQFGTSFEMTMRNAMMSSENFLTSFIDGIKVAIKQLLVQLAVTAFINTLMGGTGVGKLLGIGGGEGNIFGDALGNVLPFASGGLVSGPTLGLIGEGPGTSISNPEVVAPLNQLQSMMGGAGGGVEVFGRISGADILISSDRARDNRKRTRGY